MNDQRQQLKLFEESKSDAVRLMTAAINLKSTARGNANYADVIHSELSPTKLDFSRKLALIFDPLSIHVDNEFHVRKQVMIHATLKRWENERILAFRITGNLHNSRILK